MAMDDGYTALHLSVQQGHLSVSLELVKAGADVNAKEPQGSTPLHLAAGLGHSEIVAALVEAGADIDSRAGDGNTPLYVAAMNGHLGAAKNLLRANANPLLPKWPSTWSEILPLDIAAYRGHSEVVCELIQKYGIEGCGGGSGGVKALEAAAINQHVGIMTMLADAGVVDTGSALFNAAARSREASVKFLLQQRRGATTDVGVGYTNYLTDYCLLPMFRNLYVLPREGGMSHLISPKVLRLLIDAGADTSSPVGFTKPSREVIFNGTPLAFTNDCIRSKQVGGNGDAREEQRCRLEAVRRLLLRVEAVHAVSWLWLREPVLVSGAAATSKVSSTGTARKTPAEGTSLALMLPIMRRRRRGVLWDPCLGIPVVPSSQLLAQRVKASLSTPHSTPHCYGCSPTG